MAKQDGKITKKTFSYLVDVFDEIWQAAARQWARRESDFGKKQDSVYTSDASYDLDVFNKRAIGLE